MPLILNRWLSTLTVASWKTRLSNLAQSVKSPGRFGASETLLDEIVDIAPIACRRSIYPISESIVLSTSSSNARRLAIFINCLRRQCSRREGKQSYCVNRVRRKNEDVACNVVDPSKPPPPVYRGIHNKLPSILEEDGLVSFHLGAGHLHDRMSDYF